MKYQIVLTSVQWDPSYQNARRFGSRTAQETYFDVANKFTATVPVRNLDYGNFTRLSIYVKTGQAGIGDIMAANYAIIKDITVANSPKYWYYFITNATFDSADQVKLELQMDVIQCYYIDMTFNESMIERAHLNRWTQIQVGTTKFSNSLSSPFYVRDELRGLSKRIKSVTQCTTTPFTVGGTLSNWLHDNIYCWAYVYLDAGTYEFDGASFSSQMLYKRKVAGVRPPEFKSPYVVVCCPIFNNSTANITIGGKGFSQASFIDFITANQANIYNLKITQFTPWAHYNAPTATIDTVNNTLDITSNENVSMVGSTTYIGVVVQQNLEAQYLTKSYTLPQASITKEAISTYALDLVANPKSYNTDYRELKVVYAGGEYSFDIQKLFGSAVTSATAINFDCFEILTPEVAPTFISVVPTALDPVYKSTTVNRIGYVAQNDLSIPYSKNQLDVFLANNKNFFIQKEKQYTVQKLQTAISAGSNMISSTAGMISGALTGDIAGAVKQGANALLGTAAQLGNMALSIDYDKTTTKYTLDNMASGVDALANSNSNSFFTLALTDCKIILQELEALPVDLGRALEDMHENGYIYNRMGNIKSFDNIRSKWNYIKANLEIIKTPVKIPNEVRNTIKQIFANGIRFWNTDTWDFEQTNLEN